MFQGKSLVDTILSILRTLLLYFIILDLNSDYLRTHYIYHIDIYLSFELIFAFITLNFLLFIKFIFLLNFNFFFYLIFFIIYILFIL